MKIVFATANQHKIEELRQLLPTTIELIGLQDINCTEEIPETQHTIEGNASQKSHFIFGNFQLDCFADDTGLEIEALAGRPGVLSARYAGEQKNATDNINKVLDELKHTANRNARFKTVISLLINNKEIQFEGIVNGTILHSTSGSKGFGYDPIFAPLMLANKQPNTQLQSFAEMSMEDKNKISHRGIAVQKLISYLSNEL
jgi:XTP/dITP diphosphohydrolase